MKSGGEVVAEAAVVVLVVVLRPLRYCGPKGGDSIN